MIYLFNKLLKKLLSYEFLYKDKEKYDSINSILRSHELKEQVDLIIESNNYSIKLLLEVFKPILDVVLAEEQNVDYYLKMIYEFTLSKSFPHAVNKVYSLEEKNVCLLFLDLISIFNNFERKNGINIISSQYPINLLTVEEEKNSTEGNEYKKFKKLFKNYYIYEMMQLNKELTGFNTIDHVSGVHYLSIYIARQLSKKGIIVDLGRVSGSALGHDIGKYGCTGEELKRVPYYHYYYTDQWFKKNGIPFIGNVASNHSTWDLELENLSLESLILIYSDFRVKNIKENGKYVMSILTLSESFGVILSMLDNVDNAKEKRYKKVYSKLLDFENFMINLGISVELNSTESKSQSCDNYSLMKGEEIVDNIKFLAINHNINLMYNLRNDTSLSSILEIVKSEKNPQNIRAFIEAIEEYTKYLSQSQKIITINFLYDLLTHVEEDIRKHSSVLIGKLISNFDEKFGKEIPENAVIFKQEITSTELFDKYIKLYLNPPHKLIDLHKEWVMYGLKIMIEYLFLNSSEEKKESYAQVLYNYYDKIDEYDFNTKLYIIQTIKYLPTIDLNNKHLDGLFKFICNMVITEDITLRLLVLERVNNLLPRIDEGSYFIKNMSKLLEENIDRNDEPGENYLKYKIAQKLNLNDEIVNKYKQFYIDDYEKTSEIFLKNLKSSTNWILKKLNIQLLLQQVIDNPSKDCFNTALHLCNLLKVSEIENVRNHAGSALVRIVPYLSLYQRNELTIELLRALEIQGYRITKYIPEYLGQVMLFLHPIEFDEIINDFVDKVRTSSKEIKFLLIKTIGVAIQNYQEYNLLFEEENGIYEERLIKMLGILLTGFGDHDIEVKQRAFNVIGNDIFDSNFISLEDKGYIFSLIAKKILTMIPNIDSNILVFLTNAASLNDIYRFIGNHQHMVGDLNIKTTKKVAFFPGTFDPFSIGHKEIVKSIRNKGFEVYLAVDEFSWSKNTHPHKLRRKIVDISISNELNIYLFPEEIPINISNSRDLEYLKSLFVDSELYIVVGSDVIRNASTYEKGRVGEIHNFNHIIIQRDIATDEDLIGLKNKVSQIKGDVINIALDEKFNLISSTQIRESIDFDKDISYLIDPLAQKFIYDYGLYRKEPLFKKVLKSESLDIEITEDIDDEIFVKYLKLIDVKRQLKLNNNYKLKDKLNPRLLVVKNSINNEVLGISLMYWIRSGSLFNEYKDQSVTEYIRNYSSGRVLAIGGIFVNREINSINLEEILLTETLTFAISKDYNYCVFKNIIENYNIDSLVEIIRLQGFLRIPSSLGEIIYGVSLDKPSTLYLDTEAYIKEPFKSNKKVKNALLRSRKRLQRTLTKLYPGEAVITFDKGMIYQSLIKRICETNNVDIEHQYPRKLGKHMCVPFGSILKGEVVSNTVTKSMHTEKFFEPNIEEFNIGPYPYYMSLENQIKMIKSFDRSVILVDDILNKGYRLKSINNLLKKEDINVEKIIVGILSGRGKELMSLQDRNIEAAYYIPNLKLWFNESDLYPFIGGDSVWRGIEPEKNMLKSVNLILPYKFPAYIKGVNNEVIYELSRTAINNALDIISTLEREYQKITKKSLTLSHLSEVITSPRCPDKGDNFDYDLNLRASQYLLDDLEQLERIEKIIYNKVGK